MDKQARQHDILTRGVEDVIEQESLKEKLESGRTLRVKFGIDPTGPNIHLGRAIPLRKLRAFQKLGHTIVLIVGDFTARIGDPSDKFEKRPMLTKEQIEENLKGYKEQLGKILDIDAAEFRYNSTWLSELRFEEIANLAESFTVQQMANRRNFKNRLDEGKDISLREFLYPLMQGYDSVAVEADVEVGGFDQLFNLKAGRTIQAYYGQKRQDIMTLSMLEGTDGRKMSTSWGNVVTIVDEPNEMFGKIMSLRDDLIEKYFLLCTDMLQEEIATIQTRLAQENPRDVKLDLAEAVVTLYHGQAAAQHAHQYFTQTFSEREIPDDIPTVRVEVGTPLGDILLKEQVIESKSEFKRLVDQGAIHDLTHDVTIDTYDVSVTTLGVYKIGKRRFIQIEV